MDPPKSQSPSVGPSASGPVDVPALEAPALRDVDGSARGKNTDGAGTADVRGLPSGMAVVVTVVGRPPGVWASAKCIATSYGPGYRLSANRGARIQLFRRPTDRPVAVQPKDADVRVHNVRARFAATDGVAPVAVRVIKARRQRTIDRSHARARAVAHNCVRGGGGGGGAPYGTFRLFGSWSFRVSDCCSRRFIVVVRRLQRRGKNRQTCAVIRTPWDV